MTGSGSDTGESTRRGKTGGERTRRGEMEVDGKRVTPIHTHRRCSVQGRCSRRVSIHDFLLLCAPLLPPPANRRTRPARFRLFTCPPPHTHTHPWYVRSVSLIDCLPSPHHPLSRIIKSARYRESWRDPRTRRRRLEQTTRTRTPCAFRRRCLLTPPRLPRSPPPSPSSQGVVSTLPSPVFPVLWRS